MADGIEHFSEKKNLARVTAGIKESGPFYKSPNTPKPMNFEDGFPSQLTAKYMGDHTIPQGPVMDTWVERRTNSNLK